jgi:tRNA (mo5U34)-methyltransferase
VPPVLRRGRRRPTVTEEELAAMKGRWWHSIDLGNGLVTEGAKSPGTLHAELMNLGLPAVKGKTVLDIGAWDGYFSFACERLGASRVVALDHFVWSLRFFEQQQYSADCRARGEAPKPFDQVPELWDPVGLPGKDGFDLARRALGSKVEDVVADFMTVDLDKLGTFDIVLYLGVLYHMPNPVASLERVAAVTREVAIIETEAVVVPGHEDRAMCEFFETDELDGDPTNWWAPNIRALVALCKAAGFRKVDTSVNLAEHQAMPAGSTQRYRTIVQAWK